MRYARQGPVTMPDRWPGRLRADRGLPRATSPGRGRPVSRGYLSGRFVLIDWPGLGAAPRGSQAVLALEILLRFGAADPAPLVELFLAGWVPAGLDQSRLEDLRLWWAHGILWWAGLSLSLGADPDTDLTGVYAAARHSLENDDQVSWLSRDAAAAAP